MGRVTSKSIKDDEVVKLAISLGWSTNPTTDLCKAIRGRFKCSDAVAMKVYGRVTDRGLIRQETKLVGFHELQARWRMQNEL